MSIRQRRSIRLRDYDYTRQGVYFVTICTYRRECSLGKIHRGGVELSRYGAVVQEEWLQTGQARPSVALDAFIIMPNHLHGILWLRAVDQQAPGRVARPKVTGGRGQLESPGRGSLSAVVRGFKAASTRRINRLRHGSRCPFWQRGFFERIVRGEAELTRIRAYIQGNPQRWRDDPTLP